jgi:hypothetical protein
MEVTEAQLDLTQATDALTKARVSIHSAQLSAVEADVQAGNKVTAKAYAAGEAAMRERAYRRKGLAISVVAILAVVLALGAYLKDLERKS